MIRPSVWVNVDLRDESRRGIVGHRPQFSQGGEGAMFDVDVLIFPSFEERGNGRFAEGSESQGDRRARAHRRMSAVEISTPLLQRLAAKSEPRRWLLSPSGRGD